MCKKIILTLILLFISVYPVYAENGILMDDCVDLSVVSGCSEGIYTSVIEEESRDAYDGDYTMFMRRELTEEWVEYKIERDVYPVFNTYFRQNEEISHFVFEESADGESWSVVRPQIKINPVESYKWIPVTYTLKSIKSDSEYIRIKFSNKNAVEWSPMIASVYLHYKTTDKSGFADCVNTPFEEDVALLKNLGFTNGYNQYEYKPYNDITRAEFAKMNADILNIGNQSAEIVFSDVGSDHWASGYIASLYRQGIINGDENGRFNPENNVTYTEAAKMIVSSLGYAISAEDNGGYPSGFIMIAERLGIFDGVTETDKDAALSRGDMAIMVRNALERDILQQTAFGDEAVFEKSGTLLEVYHGIKNGKGMLEGADGCSVVADMNVESDTAVIDGEVYTEAEFDVSEFLGENISFYYDAEDKIILYAESEAKNIVNITADKFLRLDDNKLYYDDGSEKERYVSVDNNTRIIYNGRYKTRVGVTEDISIKCGDIRLICNDSSIADTIIIKEYNMYIPLTDGKLDTVMNDRISGAVNLDISKADNVFLNIYGEEVQPDEAFYSKGDVVSVAESEDGKVMYIDISSLKVAGIVKYINESKKTLIIDDTEYEYTDSLIKFNGDISLGAYIDAYFDVNKRIFAIENKDNEEYAYLINCGDEDSFSGKINLKLLMQSGEVVAVTASNETLINGKRNNINGIADSEPQLIRIRKKADNSLAEIIIGEGEKIKTDYSSENSKYYGGVLCVFASKYQLGSETPVFYIPEDDDEARYKTIDRYGLYSDFNYNARIYNVSDEYVAGAVVVYENGSRERFVDSYDEVAIVRDVQQITNAEGELCLNLSVYIKGQERNVYFDNEGGKDYTWNWVPDYSERITADGANPFKTGEVIQFYSDSESHCRSFRMMLTDEMIKNTIYYEKNTGDYGQLNSENYFSELYTAFAKIEERFSDKILISTDGETLRTVPIQSASIYLYNRDRNTLRLATAGDIYQGADVFVRMVYGEPVDIIVFE